MRTTSEALDLEMAVAPIMARQMAFGVEFDREKAEQLELTLIAKKAELRQELQRVFIPKYISKGETTPKINRRVKSGGYYTHYIAGGTYTKVVLQEYNPSSRKQTIDRLCEELGWSPTEFTDKGNAEFNESIIEDLPFKQVKPLKDFFMLNKRLGQLSDGAKAWLKVVQPDGRIYGSVMQSGTITGRMTHFAPNMSQIPSNDKPYGVECRSLFKVPEGKVQIGCDADALEMRVCAGYLANIDGGEFINTVLKGNKADGTDMHTLNSYAYEIDTIEGGRDCAKVLFYASLYGAGNGKLGIILLSWGVDPYQYVDDFGGKFKRFKSWSEREGKNFTDKQIECHIIGKEAVKKFGERMPTLPKLIEDVQARWKEQGYLKGLDGRKLFPRNAHSAVNVLFQSAGSIIMKRALVIADNDLQVANLTPGKDYEFIINCHDEWQLEVSNNVNIIKIVTEILPKAITKAGEYYNFKCPMTGNVMIGNNWSQCH